MDNFSFSFNENGDAFFQTSNVGKEWMISTIKSSKI